ncbi:hypothetical protein AL065_23410 [Pseudomonas amygdali pv. ulmi]|nr:hypothetical protein AL065_23410 [Pseudomonas amygdali pv. ulmi]
MAQFGELIDMQLNQFAAHLTQSNEVIDKLLAADYDLRYHLLAVPAYAFAIRSALLDFPS